MASSFVVVQGIGFFRFGFSLKNILNSQTDINFDNRENQISPYAVCNGSCPKSFGLLKMY